MSKKLLFKTLDWNQAHRQHHDDWERLLNELNINPTQSIDWLNATAQSSKISPFLKVLTGWVSDELIGVIPFYVHTTCLLGFKLKTVELATNIISYHNELITKETHYEMLSALLNCEETEGWQLFKVSSTPDNSKTGIAIAQYSRNHHLIHITYKNESSPYLAINSSWEDFLASKPGDFRYKIRKRYKKFTAEKNHEITWYETEASTKVLLERILSIESHSWKVPIKTAITCKKHEQHYYELLLPILAKKDALMANVLSISGHPIAYNLCCTWNGWIGQLKTSYDERFSHLSPGSVAMDLMIKKAFDCKAKEFDFLGGSNQHKLFWSKKTRRHNTYYLFSRSRTSNTLGRIKLLLQLIKHCAIPTKKDAKNHTQEIEWELHPIEKLFNEYRLEWEQLRKNEMQSHPLLDLDLISLSLKFFKTCNVVLAVGKINNKTHVITLIESTIFLRKKLFQPTQLPLCPIVISKRIANESTLIYNMLHALPGHPLSIDLKHIDPDYTNLPDLVDGVYSEKIIYGTTITIDTSTGFERFWKERPKKLRQNIARYLRRLEKEQIFYRLEVVTSTDKMESSVQMYGDIESTGWKGKLGTAIHKSNVQGEFYSELLTLFSKNNGARIYNLYYNKQLVASRLAIHNNGILVFLKTTYDENSSKYAPGRIMLYLAIQDSFKNDKITKIEFYTKATKDQLQWSDKKRDIYNLTWYRSGFYLSAINLYRAARQKLLKNNKACPSHP